MINKLGAFLSSVLVAYALAAIASTQSVLARLAELGINVSIRQRLHAIGHDLIGMSSSFLPLIAAGFLVALLVAGYIARRAPRWRVLLYALAGATAILAIHMSLNAAFGITPVAAARSGAGMLVQALAGAAGGYVFFRLTPPPRELEPGRSHAA